MAATSNTTVVRVRLTEAGNKALVRYGSASKMYSGIEGSLIRATRRGNVIVLVDGYKTAYEYSPNFWELVE